MEYCGFSDIRGMESRSPHPLSSTLESRAGASDSRRDHWLEERRSGVTSTEIAKLWRSRNLPKAMTALASQKLSSWEGFTGNSYTDWGNQREGPISLLLKDQHGIHPESRVFRSAHNPRWLASPDGLVVTPDGEVWVSEIKTSGDDIAVGSIGFHKKRYLAQMVWSMGVLGASKCLYSWEYRLGTPYEGFIVGDRSEEWLLFSEHEKLWEDLQVIADQFLVELDLQSPALDAPF